MKRVSCTNQYFFLLTEKGRPVSRGVQEVRSHPPPPPLKKKKTAKVRILILNNQVKENSRLK